MLAGPPCLPCLLTLAARDGTWLGAILVAEGSTTGGQDHIGVAHASSHCLDDLRNPPVHLAEHRNALGLVTLDEATSQEGIPAGFGKRPRTQALLRFDRHEACIRSGLAKDVPHALHIGGRAVAEAEERRGQVDITYTSDQHFPSCLPIIRAQVPPFSTLSHEPWCGPWPRRGSPSCCCDHR